MLLNNLFFGSILIHVLYIKIFSANKVPLRKFSSFSINSFKKNIKKPFQFKNLDFCTLDNCSEMERIPEAAILSKLVYDIDYNILKNGDEIPSKIILNTDKHFLKHAKKYFDALTTHNIVLDDLYIEGYFVDNKIQGFSVTNHCTKEIYMIYRGNQFWNEWTYSLIYKSRKLPFLPQYNFHSGIYQLYSQNNINQIICDSLIKLYEKHPDYSKIFAGHSRGSVNCVLNALEVLYKRDKIKSFEKKKETISLYTFGCPPLFTREFSSFLHNHTILNIYQIQNDDDLITHIPLYDNCQFGQRIVMKGDKQFTFWANIVPVYLSRFMNCLTHIVQSINEHDMSCYIQRIFSNFL